MRFGVRQIVSLYSFKNTLLRDFIDYYSNDNIIRELNTFNAYHSYPIEVFYLTCLIIASGLFISSFHNKKELKLEKIQDKNVARFIKVFLIIFTMIFTKNIENAI